MMPPEPASSLAIVMPVLNEAAGIEAALRALAPLRARGARLETGRRARRIEADGAGWRCDDWHGDAIIVATSSATIWRASHSVT